MPAKIVLKITITIDTEKENAWQLAPLKWFGAAMNFGFIISDDGGAEVFFHLSKLKNPSGKVEAGYIVNYTLGKKAEKQFAFDATVISSDTIGGFDRHPDPKSTEKAQILDARRPIRTGMGIAA
jgi:cold shock CspA family protein